MDKLIKKIVGHIVNMFPTTKVVEEDGYYQLTGIDGTLCLQTLINPDCVEIAVQGEENEFSLEVSSWEDFQTKFGGK